MAEWSAGVARKPHCRNCDAFAPDQFCSVCGQETQIALPTVRQIMRDAGGSLVAIDGRLWRTLQALLFRPGLLTLEYLRGRRKHYIRPARLFFITALLLFAVMRLVDSPSMVIDSPVGTGSTANAPDTKAAAAGGVPGAGKAHADTEAIQDDIDVQRAIAAMSAKLPSGLRNNLEHFVRLSPQDGAKQVYGAVLRFGPYAMVMLLPVFALLLWLSYLPQRLSPTRRRRYAEHLVYGAHLHAFAFLTISAIILSPLAVVRYALAVWIVVYVWRARRKIDGGSRLASFARVVFVAAVYVVLLGFTMTALIALAMVL
ncbi:MAG: DUF3667 domain-containing protein [Casimicrobiaceae bacterium]